METQYIVIGHGSYPSAMLESVRMITGIEENVHAVELRDGEDNKLFEEKLQETVKALDEADHIVLFADLLGGSPANSALSLYAAVEKVDIIASANLPLILSSILSNDVPSSLIGARESMVDVKVFANSFEDDE